ncbi:hypothetical protein PPEP_a1739 [Pseudoalteromonas peptidolytica F12-50-A1]|uniref:EpsG family protein n=2 Tax=Pseudoalteromonas peptidolytica TaxID=61150 RepID=A0A8I0T6K1_9GAMM|nr:EpsG family protein [Pseudoalteromonas peptidolytica]MBE0347314.1 hypothetical protein [Pseudoalteromonas peptidolytica F12-50-A1]
MLSLVTHSSMVLIKSGLLFSLFLSFFNSRVLSFLLFLFLLLFMAIVLNSGLIVSHDSVVYYIPFFQVETWREFEPGFTFINYIFRSAGLSAESFIYFIGTFSLFIFLTSIWKLTRSFPLFYLMLFLAFCTLSFNFLATGLLRQYLAFSIILLGCSFFYFGKKVKFFLSLFVATTIHFSSCLYFFVIFVFKLRWVNKILILIFAFLFSFFSKDVVLILLNNIPYIDNNIYVKSLVRVLGYSDKNVVHEDYFFKYFFVFISLLAVGMGKVFFSVSENGEKLINVLYSFSVCGFLVSSACYFASEASIRVLYGVAILSTLSFAALLMNSNLKNRMVIVGLVCIPFFFYSFLSHNWIVGFVNRYV